MIIPLEKKKLPDKWYNVIPDLAFAVLPPMTSTGHAMGPHHLADIATDLVIQQELEDKEREVPIPWMVRDLYSEWRPTPLYRAERWERSLETPARIFYKYEGGSPAGNYEANTAIPQAWYASQQGVKELVTATANGEMGIALAIACNYFNLKCKVFMVRSSYDSKEYGRYIMELLGADVSPSPSLETGAGREALEKDPESPGSLGLALSEAFAHAYASEDVKFCWGTVVKHVVLHHTIIGAPSLSKGKYRYDYADAAGMSALYKMYTLGRNFVPPGIRAGGMRYHGISPIISALYREGEIEARTHSQHQALEAAISFARVEGIVPSPESSYTVKAVADEALVCRENRQRKDILFMLNANGNLEVATFRDFLAGAIEDQPFLEKEVGDALSQLPEVNDAGL